MSAPSVTTPLDPALPALEEWLTPSRVARLFERRWPGPGPAPDSIVHCALHDVRYWPGRRCATSWWIDATGEAGRSGRTIGVVEIDGDGIRHRLYCDDPALAGLGVAVDGAAMGARLAGALDLPANGWAASPVRYRAGERAVLRYDRSAGGEGGRKSVFAKALATGAPELAATLIMLARASRRTHGMPQVEPPLALFADLDLVVQAPVRGTSLRQRLFGASVAPAAASAALEQAGRSLAGFHSCGAGASRSTTLADDLATTRVALSEVQRAITRTEPALGAHMESVLERLAREGAGVEPLVPSHGSFRADHLYFDGDRTAVLDVDGFRTAERERDASNLLAYLTWKAVREPVHQPLAAAAAEAFMSGYAAGGIPLDRHRLDRYQAASLMRIAAGRFRNLALAEWPLVPGLVDVAAHLAGR